MTFKTYLDNLSLTVIERRALKRDLRKRGVHYFTRSDVGIDFVVAAPTPRGESYTLAVAGCCLLGGFLGWMLGTGF